MNTRMATTRSEEWWDVVKIMAEYLACGYTQEDLEEICFDSLLEQRGYSKNSISQALDWLEDASLSGNISDILSMANSDGSMVRIPNPIETIGISERLWRILETLRLKGMINSDLAEKVLEGVRGLDSRDWEEDEIEAFIKELLSTSLPFISEEQLELVSKGLYQDFYA